MAKKQIFRQEALGKLSSPEQLDQAITITDSRGWLVLAVFTIIIIVSTWWIIRGTIPVTITGEGILLKGGGMHEIISIISGSIIEFNIKTGDIVEKDEVMVKLVNPQISDMDVLINETEGELEKFYENKEKNRKLIDKLNNKLKLLKEKRSILSEIKSPIKGKILNIIAKPYGIIREHDAIAVIESLDETVEAVIYIPISTEKKIEPSMEVQISPNTVRREIYGFIPGKIKSVDVFPKTKESMMKVIGNEELVNMFLSSGPSMEIHVELSCDKNRQNGFKWSSGRGGPPFTICSGTLCRGTIILKKVHPVNLLFPSL